MEFFNNYRICFEKYINVKQEALGSNYVRKRHKTADKVCQIKKIMLEHL